MSAELRRLLHSAAETGPLPDVDAIVAQVRRRHRRRVALSVGVSVLAAVIAVATFWQPKQEARDDRGESAGGMPNRRLPTSATMNPPTCRPHIKESEGGWIDVGKQAYHPDIQGQRSYGVCLRPRSERSASLC